MPTSARAQASVVPAMPPPTIRTSAETTRWEGGAALMFASASVPPAPLSSDQEGEPQDGEWENVAALPLLGADAPVSSQIGQALDASRTWTRGIHGYLLGAIRLLSRCTPGTV